MSDDARGLPGGGVKTSDSRDGEARFDDQPKPAQKRANEQSSSELRYPRKRSVRACHLCRARKTKCDNVQPICGFCASIGANCSYDGKQHDHSSFDSASLEILRKLSELQDSQNEIFRILRSIGAMNSHTSPPMFTPPVHGASGPLASTPGSNGARVETLPAMSPANYTDNSYNNVDRLVQASVSSSSPYLARELRDPIKGYAQPQPSPQDYAEASSENPGGHGNPAAVRWFDLLANDAGKDMMQASLRQSELDSGRSFSTNHDGSNATPLQRATRIIDDDNQSTSTQQPYDPLADAVQGGMPRRLLERRLWQADEDIPLMPREQVLFDRFVHQVSSALDLFDPRRTFSAVVSRLALRNAGLMNAILAVSCHYASIDPDAKALERSDHNTPLQYYDQTLHYVQKAMRYSSYQTSRELLATTLTISIYEMLAGSRKDWDRHLKGVFWILRSQKIDVETDGVESAVWWAWLRQDIWAAFREKRQTYTTWMPTKSYVDLSPHELASRSIWIMAQVVSFCCVDGTGANDQGKVVDRLGRATELRQMLDEWYRHLTVEFAPLPGKPYDGRSAFRPISIYPSCFGIAVQVHYVSKILVCINEPCLGGMDVYLERLRTVQAWIRIVCGIAMTLTDDSSSMMCSQCLFIAGLFSQDDRERDCILEMLEDCCQRSGWWSGSLGDDVRKAWLQTKPHAIAGQ